MVTTKGLRSWAEVCHKADQLIVADGIEELLTAPFEIVSVCDLSFKAERAFFFGIPNASLIMTIDDAIAGPEEDTNED